MYELDKSISQLGGWKWEGTIPSIETHGGIETRFYNLHNKPISDLDDGDIRFLIGQNEGLNYLVPIALNKLKNDVFLEAEFYEGDLLYSLLTIIDTKNYWYEHIEQKQVLINLFENQKERLHELGSLIGYDLVKKIKEAYHLYKST